MRRRASIRHGSLSNLPPIPEDEDANDHPVVDENTLITVSEAITELGMRDVPKTGIDFSHKDMKKWVKAHIGIWSRLQEFYKLDHEGPPRLKEKFTSASEDMVNYWKRQSQTLRDSARHNLDERTSVTTKIEVIAVQVAQERLAWLVAELEMIKQCPDKNVLKEHDILTPANLEKELGWFRMCLVEVQDRLQNLPGLESPPRKRREIKELMWGLGTKRGLI